MIYKWRGRIILGAIYLFVNLLLMANQADAEVFHTGMMPYIKVGKFHAGETVWLFDEADAIYQVDDGTLFISVF